MTDPTDRRIAERRKHGEALSFVDGPQYSYGQEREVWLPEKRTSDRRRAPQCVPECSTSGQHSYGCPRDGEAAPTPVQPAGARQWMSVAESIYDAGYTRWQMDKDVLTVDEIAELLAAASVPVTERHGLYIASKTKHAAKWKALRESGVPIISTWIDEAGEGETVSYEDLWRRCIAESKSAAAFIVYAEPGETLKGALVEMGAAIAAGTPVFSVGEIGKPLWESILTTKCASIEEALLFANRTAPAREGE